jgi:hypothetical protein
MCPHLAPRKSWCAATPALLLPHSPVLVLATLQVSKRVGEDPVRIQPEAGPVIACAQQGRTEQAEGLSNTVGLRAPAGGVRGSKLAGSAPHAPYLSNPSFPNPLVSKPCRHMQQPEVSGCKARVACVRARGVHEACSIDKGDSSSPAHRSRLCAVPPCCNCPCPNLWSQQRVCIRFSCTTGWKLLRLGLEVSEQQAGATRTILVKSFLVIAIAAETLLVITAGGAGRDKGVSAEPTATACAAAVHDDAVHVCTAARLEWPH